MNITATNTQLTQLPKTAYNHIANASVQDKVTFGTKVANIVRYTTHSLQSAFGAIRSARPCEPLKVVFLPVAPLAVVNAVQAARSIPGASLNDKVDAGLTIVASVGDFGDAVATTAEGLVGLGLVTSEAIAWASPLFVGSVGLQLAGLALGVKNLAETHRFSVVFNKAAEPQKAAGAYTVEDYRHGLDAIESKKGAKHFGVDEEKLASRLMKIEMKAREVLTSQVDEEKSAKAQEKMKHTVELLSKRLSTVKWCKALGLLAATVSIVGIGILIFGSMPPVGFGLLAAGAALYFGGFFTRKTLTAEFETAMKLNAVATIKVGN